MSTHKHIDKICLVAVVLAVLLCAVFMNGEALGIQKASGVMGYETRLFDTSKVHTVDIVMDDWDEFLATCENEEYAVCSVVIDGEAYRNVGIRAKGNTSLSSVSAMNSDRYSFKIEFDQYDSTKSYHGLDKLSLNNLIQDSTMMKDYLTYRMMGEFGAEAPLCSYVYITVNGEDWGLYLAVEAIEDAFLRRNYGSDHGELYKPDSMNFGGGRGNGQDFDMNDLMGGSASGDDAGRGNFPEGSAAPQMPGGGMMGGMPGGTALSGWFGGNGSSGKAAVEDSGANAAAPQTPQNFDPSTMFGGTAPEGSDASAVPGGSAPEGSDASAMPGGSVPEGFDPSSVFGGTVPEGSDFSNMFGGSAQGGSGFPQGGFDFGGMFGMGSGETKLQYMGDDPASYSTIFSSAKTDITEADQKRLIQSLKALSEGGDIESVVDVDSVLRYFVVHNFVVNSDSYTGAMVHNYYLYEEDGLLSMLPWDYNLAFGSFQGGDATGAVNDPIDTPLSVSGSGDRPMADWIFRSEEYTQLYHRYFAEFLETVDVVAMIDETAELIAPYVEKDPTKFCTTEEFENGAAAIREFCRLRTESVRGQLNGTVPATDAGQSADGSALVDASGITLSAMGSMGMGGGNRGEDGAGFPGGSFSGGDFSGGSFGGGTMPGGMPQRKPGGAMMP